MYVIFGVEKMNLGHIHKIRTYSEVLSSYYVIIYLIVTLFYQMDSANAQFKYIYINNDNNN